MRENRTIRARLVWGATATCCMVLLLTGSIGGFSFAQGVSETAESTEANNNVMRISPVRQDVSIERGDSKEVSVYVQNVTNEPATFRALTNDFIADNEQGRPAIILDEGKEAPTHSLKRFMSPISNVTVMPGERKEVKVLITIPSTAQAGGYYGAVRFAPVSEGGDANVNISGSLGSLILVKVPGEYKEDLRVDTFELQQLGEAKARFENTKDAVIVTRFTNAGDAQEEPFGKITLKKGTEVIAEYEINDTNPRGSVLPDTTRRFDIPLDKELGFGKYTLEGNFGYGTQGALLTNTYNFTVLPQWVIYAALGLAGFVLLIVFIIVLIIRRSRRRNRWSSGRRRHY